MCARRCSGKMVSVLGVFGACDFAVGPLYCSTFFYVGNLYWWVTHDHASEYAPIVGRWWPNVKGLRRWEFLSLPTRTLCMQFFSHKFQDEQELKEIAHFNKLSRNQITVFLVFCYLTVFSLLRPSFVHVPTMCKWQYFELHAPVAVQVTFFSQNRALIRS